ncbi:GNAT family N-acetyltransferase [Streptomyces sp. SL13]|uniref:GNAT family N-acetyltransferase n=1 Tax=Streptantibioticus silvisoli TaxID=2705255 RepID=A0AA90HBE8_9ACTN|nr:GNAT family N-acetyltransferase [Streptantibioticus silvisoli]MDI5973427.1 GNAT family N-acetyltransferase [Streptantibioticus silvisoli]
MTDVRPARPEDAAELVRLRRVMFQAMTGEDRPGPWEDVSERLLLDGLFTPDGAGRFGAFVVDAEAGAEPGTHAGAACDGTGGGGSAGDGRSAGGAVRLAACAVATVEQRLTSPGGAAGLFGFVFNVCTDPDYRGRGYARAVTAALLDWLTARGVTRVDLHATPQAEGLYRSMGFTEHPVALSLELPGATGPEDGMWGESGPGSPG